MRQQHENPLECECMRAFFAIKLGLGQSAAAAAAAVGDNL